MIRRLGLAGRDQHIPEGDWSLLNRLPLISAQKMRKAIVALFAEYQNDKFKMRYLSWRQLARALKVQRDCNSAPETDLICHRLVCSIRKMIETQPDVSKTVH